MPLKLPCTVAEVLDHGEQVYSVVLTPAQPAPRFQPGQFLHLALDPYSPGDFWPDSRAFSIASPPAERRSLRITYAVKGQFTRRMQAELQPGREVWAKLPYGEFTVNPQVPACLLAGGTGITAFSAFLSGLAPDYPQPVYLFYGARRPDLLIYRPLVEAAGRRCPNLQAFYFSEQPGAGCLPGRMDLDRIWSCLPGQAGMLFYLAGPPEMIRLFTQGLAGRGVDAGCILVDAWE